MYNLHMDLEAIEIFVKIVQVGSFAEASRQLRTPATTVSAKIAKLESDLNATLIQRTTRRLYVTPAGKSYFDRCIRALRELREAKLELEHATSEPTGTLRITATQDVVSTILPSLIDKYLRTFPKVSIDLLITNRIVDLVAEGVDLAVRAGDLVDSQLIAKKFLSISLGIYGSKDYLRQRGTPKTPKDLEAHQFIVFRRFLDRDVSLFDGRKKTKIVMKGRIIADDLLALRELAERNLGLAMIPDFMAKDSLAEGSLVRVLPQWSSGENGKLSLVYPAQEFITPRLKEFLNIVSSAQNEKKI
jgi:DNA-binding transcriptional LysR family regulator